MSLFPWCTSPYSTSIHRFYKAEEQSRIKIKFRSPQSNSRSSMVDWICNAADKFKMFTSTVHLAVYLMDLFMDNNNINDDKLGIVALVCLTIAEKYDEDDGRAPTFKALVDTLKPIFNIPDRIQLVAFNLERLVLHSLHWRLGWVTVAHFAEYYRLFAVVNGDNSPSNVKHRELRQAVQYSFDQFLNRTLFYIQLINTSPSSKASACLLAARIQNNVAPIWPKILARITWFDYNQLSPIANFLLSNGQCDAESGYSSSPEMLGVSQFMETSMTP